MTTRSCIGSNTGRNSDSDWNTDRETSMRLINEGEYLSIPGGICPVRYSDVETRVIDIFQRNDGTPKFNHTSYRIEPLFTLQISWVESFALYISNTIFNASL